MSRLEKWNMGARRVHRCPHCGTYLRMRWTSALLVVSPAAAGLAALLSINPSPPWWIAVAVAVVVANYIFWPRIPLLPTNSR